MKTLSNRQDFDSIRSRIESLTADDQRLWGSMTVGGMVCHLSDAFKVAAGEKPTAKSWFGVIPGPVMKWMALRAPVKWPPGVKTIPEVEQGVGGTPPAEFATDLSILLDSLETFMAHSGKWPRHAIFGAMTASDWMRWGFLHADHHLRQFGR